MRRVFAISFLLLSQQTMAQHCPWDCSGMILLETTVSRVRMEKLHPVLVDENYKEVTDTMYGTGKETYDSCRFLYYDDFLKYRTKKIKLHRWYGHDTAYHFATGKYLVKFNFCKYKHEKLYLRFVDPYTRGLMYHYIEIPSASRIHLHEYSSEINGRETEKILTAVKPAIITVSCEKWGLRENDCSH